MKSAAGIRLEKSLRTLEKILETLEEVKKENDSIMDPLGGKFDKKEAANIIETLDKMIEVCGYEFKPLKDVYSELEAWMLSMKTKYIRTNKFDNMGDRMSSFQDALSDLEDIKYVQLPSAANLREAETEDEHLAVWEGIDDAVSDLFSYVEAAVDGARELQPHDYISI